MKKFKTIQSAVDAIPENSAYHEIIWYINRPLTYEEWIALDDAQGDAFEKVGISLDDVVGLAGPIPFPEKDETENHVDHEDPDWGHNVDVGGEG